jgi:DNA-binding NarL/FixJ family response regulator
MGKPRVLIADDHKIVLEGLRSLLQSEFEIVGEVEDGRTLVSEAERLRPELVVADISLPNLNGIDAARQIKKINERIRIVFLTMHADVTYAAGAFEAGASGFVLKHSAPQELILAMHEAMQGKTYVTPMIAGEGWLEPSSARGSATHRGRKIDQGNRSDIEDLDPNRRISQIPDNGAAQYQDQRRAGSICRQAWHHISLILT